MFIRRLTLFCFFRLLVLGIADRAHLLSPEFEAIIVARVADAFPPLLCSPAANDAALVKAMCQILKQNSVGIQAILSRPAALVVALEDFCLRAPFTEGPPLEVALLLCDVYRKSLPTDGQKLTRLFTPWVTDMVRCAYMPPGHFFLPLELMSDSGSRIIRRFPTSLLCL